MALTVVVPDHAPPLPGPAGCRALLRMLQRAAELERETTAGATPAVVQVHPSDYDSKRIDAHRTAAA